MQGKTGRITAVDAGTSRAKFRYSYVSNEHNIDRQYLDPLTGSPYNQFGYDNLDWFANLGDQFI
jgi:hypothetical protein